MGRDSKIWGPDCGEFKAERWIDSEGKLKQVGQFKFHVFNVRHTPPSSVDVIGAVVRMDQSKCTMLFTCKSLLSNFRADLGTVWV